MWYCQFDVSPVNYFESEWFTGDRWGMKARAAEPGILPPIFCNNK